MLSERKRRIRPDMGLIAGRYILDMQGNHQRLQVRSWTSDLRMAKTIDFAWETDVWYTAKLRVDVEDGQAVVRGKVWKRVMCSLHSGLVRKLKIVTWGRQEAW